jgi:amino acid adenylation domain-containing protein
VTALYAGASNHPVPAIQYKDYAVWLEDEIRNGALVKSGEYWKKQLGNGLPILDLPLDFSRPALQTFNGESFPFTLEKDQLDKLRTIAVKEGVSVFMLLLSTVKLLLHYCSRQHEVAVGTVVAGRQHYSLKDQQGCFVNTLVLRSTFSETDTLKDYLQQVKQVLLQAYENQDYPFDKLLEEIEVVRDLSRSALFDVLVSHQVIDPVRSQFTMEGLSVKKYESTSNATASKVDLEFEFFEHENVLAAQLIYNTALFLPSTAARFVSYFHALINALIADRETLLKDVRLTTAAEDKLLAEKGAGRKTNYPVNLHFVELLKRKTEETPAAIALVEGDIKWSYAALDEWSDKLAAQLHIQHEEPVGVYMQRGVHLIGSIIAIWKAGGAYLPLEPSLPADRLSFMRDNAGLRIVLQDEQHPLPVSCEITVDVNQVAESTSSVFTPAYALTANDLAYIIYTSGSTGTPKGAMINQAGMLNHIYAKIDDFKVHSRSRIAQTASQSFDISIWQMMTSLLAGGQVHIYSHQELLDVNNFLPRIVKDGIAILQIVPSYLSEIVQPAFQGLLSADHSLEYIISTGEELKYALVEKWFEIYPAIKLVNAYGPTEAADDISHAIFDAPVRKGKVPLGYTIPNLRIYIVDKDGRLSPEGLPGEIWVSGIGVGRGYVKLPERTAAAFMDDPFYAGNRVYRTGDLGRWNADGVLEFYGRNDKQVKIRGHRVEPGETEQVIMEYPAIKIAVVVPKVLRGELLLVAYIVWKQDGEKAVSQLKEWIRQKLPEYMLPSVIIEMDQIALTVNGKIDYKQLPEPSPLEIGELHIDPRDETETIIRDLWQEILGKENISMNDNFFDLGGHSLKGIRLVAQIREKLQVNITLKDIFQAPTPAAQARVVSAVKWVSREPAPLSSLADDNVENILI